MKVTHVISDSNVGGAGVLLSLICGAMPQDIKSEVILPASSSLIRRFDAYTTLPDSNVKITPFDMSKDKSFCARDMSKFYNYFKKNPTDIVHTHASLSARLGARLASSAECISTRHCARSNESIKPMSPAKLKLYNFCTDLTISTADFATENLVREGISRDKIITIKNGVPKRERTSDNERKALRRHLNIKDGSFVLGSAARLEWVKGQDLLLRAAANIAKDMDIHLLFVGDGSRRRELMELAAGLGILDICTFTGYVENPAPYQNLFYLNINTSRGTETSCLATSECMSLGIPSLVSTFGGNREQVRDMENGLIFRSDDIFSLECAIRRVLLDPELYRELSCGALKRYNEEFSLDTMAESYAKMYLNIKD